MQHDQRPADTDAENPQSHARRGKLDERFLELEVAAGEEPPLSLPYPLLDRHVDARMCRRTRLRSSDTARPRPSGSGPILASLRRTS